MTGKIYNFCCVLLIVSHVTLQMSPCYEADRTSLKYYFFFYPTFSFVAVCIGVAAVGESYKMACEVNVKLLLLWQGWVLLMKLI